MSENKKANEKLLADLSVLGSTPDQVAATLVSKGIKGEPMRVCFCPIANYLKSIGYITPYTDSMGAGAGDIYSPVPEAVSLFIMAFDDGEFAELALGD